MQIECSEVPAFMFLDELFYRTLESGIIDKPGEIPVRSRRCNGRDAKGCDKDILRRRCPNMSLGNREGETLRRRLSQKTCPCIQFTRGYAV